MEEKKIERMKDEKECEYFLKAADERVRSKLFDLNSSFPMMSMTSD